MAKWPTHLNDLYQRPSLDGLLFYLLERRRTMINARNVRFLAKGEKSVINADTGISLHCHTMHSKEILDFVPYYAERIPILSHIWRRQQRRSIEMYGRPPEFKTGYWTPPLTGHQVVEMEAASMRSLGLNGMVSITDHDSINANIELRRDHDEETTPISMEWTVPFGVGFFHVGVHNLPGDQASAITEQLLDYTHADGIPDDAKLHELFAMLNDCDGVLIVLNHPIWDIEMIGQQLHEQVLERFLAGHAKWIHAIEVNGFRTWQENEVAIELAESLGLPTISGGDRHCLHSNTMINVTNARTFSEFVGEIRDGHSEIVVTPEYKAPLPARQVASIAQILGNFKHFPEGRRLWSERIFFDANDGGGLKTLSAHWNGHQPLWSRAALLVLALLSQPMMRPVIGLTVGDKDIGRNDNNFEHGVALSGTQIGASGLQPE